MNRGKVNCQILVCADTDGSLENAVSQQTVQLDREKGVATSNYSLLNHAKSISLVAILGTEEVERMICKSIEEIDHQSKALELSQRISKGLLHNLSIIASHIFLESLPEDNDFESKEYKQLSNYLVQQVTHSTLFVG
ncbi:hypothetical protein LMH73_028565 [Vibrio splendidus]